MVKLSESESERVKYVEGRSNEPTHCIHNSNGMQDSNEWQLNRLLIRNLNSPQLASTCLAADPLAAVVGGFNVSSVIGGAGKRKYTLYEAELFSFFNRLCCTDPIRSRRTLTLVGLGRPDLAVLIFVPPGYQGHCFYSGSGLDLCGIDKR